MRGTSPCSNLINISRMFWYKTPTRKPDFAISKLATLSEHFPAADTGSLVTKEEFTKRQLLRESHLGAGDVPGALQVVDRGHL